MFPQNALFYRNTFKLSDASKPRVAYRVPLESDLEAGVMRDLAAGKRTAFIHSSKGQTRAAGLQPFVVRKLQRQSQRLGFSVLVYWSGTTYVAVTEELRKRMTPDELKLVTRLPASRVGVDIFGCVDDEALDHVDAFNTDLTLKDIKRWWNMPSIRFTGWTSKITVGISNSVDPGDAHMEWERVYVAFKANGPTVRDLIQSHWRHRRVSELVYSVRESNSVSLKQVELVKEKVAFGNSATTLSRMQRRRNTRRT